jgi:signal transduction histidine kinase
LDEERRHSPPLDWNADCLPAERDEGAKMTADPKSVTAPGVADARLVPSELALLRFIAGIRALLAVLIGILLIADASMRARYELMVMLPYLVWAAVLLRKTLNGWPLAASKVWLWLDAGALLVISQLVAHSLPLFGISTVLPVVALAILSGAVPATALALACVAGLLALSGYFRSLGSFPPLPVSVSIIMLCLGPAATLLTRPSRELRLRLKLVDTLNERSDPRQGLRHHVSMLLEQLHLHFGLTAATISLQGPEPRIFQWRETGVCVELVEEEARQWRERLDALPRTLGCLRIAVGRSEPTNIGLHPATGAISDELDEGVKRALSSIRPQTLTLPLMNYGQPLGTLCITRSEMAFGAPDLRWLNSVMREIMPLLERSDLLEQLQRETAARERERIGRDLHDSAVQPYLGLKYGLEAIARQAGPHNVVTPQIQQLVKMTTEELQTLRDVISGLRRGNDPAQADNAPLAALQRQAQRFEALYGLKVNIFAPDAPRLRGAAAKAVLHMVNEALTNVRRHTSATGVTVLLDVNASDILIRLRNDHGRGEALVADFLPRSLTDRAAEFGGTVEVNHQPDFTEIVISLPLLGAIG